MDELLASIRRDRAQQAMLPLFFVSGATGLVYQTVWARQLHLVFGTSTFAIATVLSTFMAGLALGGWWMSRRADRARDPLGTYGAMELGIGAWALVFPWLVQLVQPIFLAVARTWHLGPVGMGLVQYVLVGGLLVVPTSLMGATLPLLARFATARLGAAGDRIALLYAVNTAGAVLGTWLAGFVLLPIYGLALTTSLAAAANVALGLAAMALGRQASGAATAPIDDDLAAGAFAPELAPVAVATALAGFASLIDEVAWFRLLGLMLGGSTYAFSVMLLAFLVGIALGGRWGGPWADRVLARHGPHGVLRLLAGLQIAVAGSTVGLMYLYPELPFWYVWAFDSLNAENATGGMWVVSLLLSGVVMVVPALFMGASFPVAVRAVVGETDALGRSVGRIYAANTAGAVVGAALAGFVLLPTLHVQGTILLAALANLTGAAVVGVWAERRARGGSTWRALVPVLVVAAVVAVVVRRPPWNPLLMTAGMYKYVTAFRDHSREGIMNYSVDHYDLLYYAEGLSSVVTVARNRDTDNVWLANNGKVDASTTIDMPTQVLVSLLPLQFVEDPGQVLVIGLASGITAGALTLVPDVERLDVVELEPAIRDASGFFREFNHDLLDDPRTNLIFNDGRNHVLLTPPGTYDVIVSEPSNPWLTGVSNLFTREFFELGKSRLAEGGVWSQWVQLYGMDDLDLRSLLATFSTVYPHVLLYAAAEDADIVLIGSDSPLVPSLEAADTMFRWPGVAAELEQLEVDDGFALLAHLLMDRRGVVELAGNIGLNTDDNLRIEYSAPLHLHEDTQDVNVGLLLDNARVPVEALGGDPSLIVDLARTYWQRDDPVRALQAMDVAIRRLEPGDPWIRELREEARMWLRERERSFEEAEEP